MHGLCCKNCQIDTAKNSTVPFLHINTLRNVVGSIEGFVNVHGVVDHISVVKQLDLRLQNILLGVQSSLLQEFKKREHQMTVQLRRYPRCQVVLRRHCFGFSSLRNWLARCCCGGSVTAVGRRDLVV